MQLKKLRTEDSSPVREKTFGVTQINRLVHETFKKETLDFARKKAKTPKPLGIEEIVYGDKVINIINNKREHYQKMVITDMLQMEKSV